MQLGIEVLLNQSDLLQELRSCRVGLVAHPASVDHSLRHSVDLLYKAQVPMRCLFGPQHGMRGEKQDNMIESDDYRDPYYNVPVYSLYGKVRRPTKQMLNDFDILLFDLQDVGCRIYTFLTTLAYLLEDLSGTEKQVWVLDRPNPAGRFVEGSYLKDNFHSFVGAAHIPMRHGLTLGEFARWYVKYKNLHTRVKVIAMEDYKISTPGEWGWPSDLCWVNPSPNVPTVTNTRQYAGTVLLEGTYLSEGRGTTRPLEVFGAPHMDPYKILHYMEENFSSWLQGCLLRPCFFEPTFHKFQGQLCGGLQIHVDNPAYDPSQFSPYRLVAAYLKTVCQLYPDFTIWKSPPYEYEENLLPIEILSGGRELKDWVENSSLDTAKFDAALRADEEAWMKERERFLIYS